ncbi:MAG: ATP-binding protein [Eubacteriales bacterium]|nr:ATP-binding protein [Eubacteriales bacterium]
MITILCGRVAAGKTALAARMERTGSVALSCDELMLTVFDGCLGERHDQTAMKCLRYLFSVAARLARRGLDVVIDYGFWLRAERDAARSYFAREGLPCRVLLVEAPESVRLARLARRNDGLRQASGRVYLIEGELLDRMEAKFEPPGADEIFEIFDNTEEFS